MGNNTMPMIALTVSILLSAFSGWMSWSNSSVVNDATLDTRVTTLEQHEAVNHSNTLKLIEVEGTLRRIAISLKEHDLLDGEVSEISKEVAILEVKLSQIAVYSTVNAADIRDLQISLAKIVTLIKMKEGL